MYSFAVVFIFITLVVASKNAYKLKTLLPALCLALFLPCLFIGFSGDAGASLFNTEKNNNRAGRPRFARRKTLDFYFGIGVGINPFERLENPSEMQVSRNIFNAIEGGHINASSSVGFMGMPVIVFGFVPNTARFIRNHFEAYFQYGSLSNDATSASPGQINGRSYSKLDINIISTRILYELLFQIGSPKTRYSIFLGGGFGIASQINKISGREVDPTTTGNNNNSSSNNNDTSTANLSTVYVNYGSFAPVFSGTAGFTFDMTPTIAVEAKFRYAAMMTPFGSDTGNFDIYRHSFEIFATILIKT